MRLNLGLSKASPTAQTELDLFKGQWSYRLPVDTAISGDAAGYTSTRAFLERCASLLGPFDQWNVLELGPLEGEVTYALHHMGPRRITSIEGRESSFLKCLVAKNLLGMDRARFMLGDFTKYLEQTTDRYEFCCAQGVLYHMVDPVRLLQLITRVADRCFVGTHYYDLPRLRAVADRGRTVQGIFNPLWNIPDETSERESRRQLEGFSCTYYKHRYNVSQADHENPDTHHHHGLELHAQFMTREDIVRCLEYLGMEVVDVDDEPDCPRGPYVGIIARRRSGR